MRTLAQLYTNLGWVIHPIRPPEQGNRNTGKAPFESSWQHRTTPRTPEELDKYFRGTNFNIGLLCGRSSGIIVIDIDDANFLNTLTRGIDTSNFVTSARDNETARGHIFFKYDPSLPASKHHLIGLEVLSDGNNAVLPPSLHYSGGRYRWNPGGPWPPTVTEMPARFKARLLELFKTEKKLKELLSKCRPCFRKFFETPEKLHGGDGRRFMVALATELAAASEELNQGTQERDKCLKMVAKLIYRDEYDPTRTEKELNHIDPGKTWKCSTLSQNFPDICGCEQCKFKDKDPAPSKKEKRGSGPAPLAYDMLDVAESLQAQVPVYYDQAGAYWIWTGRGYVMADETSLLITAKNKLNMRGLTQQKFKNEFLEGVRITGRERQVNPRNTAWIQFQDRVINFRTGEEFTPAPDHFFTTPLPYNLGDSEETPQIEKLFDEWVGTDKKRLLYEILAYALIDDYPIHRLFCLIGSGRNGKGQFMKLLRRFIGLNNVTSTELERIEESRFETAKLFQKKAVFIGETNFTAISKTNRLKQISGGDVITGEWKRKAPFDFVNTAKIIIATNSLPITHDRTDGFYSRWLVVDFPNRFSEGRDLVDPIPDKEFENLGRKCLRILKELLKAGGFDQEGTIEERARAYELKSNPVAAFIKSQCRASPEAWTPLYELFDVFENFQSQHGYRLINKKQFSLQLQELGYEQEKTTAAGSTMYYIQGLKLKDRIGPSVQLEFNTEAPRQQKGPVLNIDELSKIISELKAEEPAPFPPGIKFDIFKEVVLPIDGQLYRILPEPQTAPQAPPGEAQDEPPIFQTIPGAEIPDSALLYTDQDRDIIDEVRTWTNGTMKIKNLQLFIDHYCRKRPYIHDKQKIGGRIRFLNDRGWWRPKEDENETQET